MAYLVKGEPPPPRIEPVEPDPTLPRALVIGAGSSGIAVAKALYEARVPFDCFEMGPVIGGNWVFDNPNGQSSCYRTLEINTSRRRMAFSDFPMPEYYPPFPMHWQVRHYFERYVDHFGFRHTITFNTKVERVERREDGVWVAEVSGDGAADGAVRVYDAVLVANGHHWNPRWPDPPYPGSDVFEGEQMHAHYFRDPEAFEGKRVLVVGGGNSGVDVCRDASYYADAVFHSLRRGVHVIRKTLLGRPTDETTLPPSVPWGVKQKVFELARRLSGDLTRYGMPEPDHRVGHAHPTVSDHYHDRLADGQVRIVPAIRELREREVVFADGSVERVDVVVYCTGYRVTFPFFDEDFISAPHNDLPLYRRLFHPEIPGVYFIALLQPLGATMPLAEEQGRWVAELLRGRYHLPPVHEQRADIARERAAHAERFYRSDRHTMEVDFDEYMARAAEERERGARRAAAVGFAPQVPARAGRGTAEPAAA